MNTVIAVVLGAATFFVGYKYYAQRIDRDIIKSDPKKATPAKMYMDGVDFSPANRNVLYGFQFKSIAAAGPITGVITAALLWGWLPALIWLLLGVTFIGWVQDYAAMMMSVRRDGDSLSATAHKLMSPTSRSILLVFIFCYLIVIAGAFGNLVSGVLASRATVPLGIVVLALAGLLGGQMLYKWKISLVWTTVVTVGGAFLAIWLGTQAAISGPTGIVTALNAALGTKALYVIPDPTLTTVYSTSYIFWLLFTIVFCYCAAVLPIWRWAQPVNYIGFWIMAVTLIGGLIGAVVALFVNPAIATFTLAPFKGFDVGAKGAFQPLWPMLFVTVACGAISGWHALISTVGTARQLENETDALPVGGGSMFSENILAVLSLMAVSVGASGSGPDVFANGVGGFLSVFGIDPKMGASMAYAAFVIIVITVLQLVIRFMRVSLTEWLGDKMPVMRNMHVGTLVSCAIVFFVVLSGTYTYIYQLFGGANQLMASLALMLVGLWLTGEGKKAIWVWIPMLFMYATTIVANLITAYNLFKTVFEPNFGKPDYIVPVAGSAFMILLALFLVGAALYLGWAGLGAYNRLKGKTPAPVAVKP
jgi:carbon starvation protein